MAWNRGDGGDEHSRLASCPEVTTDRCSPPPPKAPVEVLHRQGVPFIYVMVLWTCPTSRHSTRLLGSTKAFMSHWMAPSAQCGIVLRGPGNKLLSVMLTRLKDIFETLKSANPRLLRRRSPQGPVDTRTFSLSVKGFRADRTSPCSIFDSHSIFLGAYANPSSELLPRRDLDHYSNRMCDQSGAIALGRWRKSSMLLKLRYTYASFAKSSQNCQQPPISITSQTRILLDFILDHVEQTSLRPRKFWQEICGTRRRS